MRDFLFLFCLGHFREDAVQCEADVAVHGEPGHQRVALEDHATFGAGAGDRFVLEADGAFGGHLKARHEVDQRGFAGAREAQENEELALLHFEIDVLEHVGGVGAFPEALGNIFKFQNTHLFDLTGLR